MNRLSKMMMVGLSLLLVQFGHANNSGSCGPAPCPPKDCPKPCPPKDCPKPCPPKPCPPKPCKPCPPVCLERGHPDVNCCLTSAYNEPADFELGPCPWDFWIDASFTYWIAYEEGLDLAHNTQTLGILLQPPLIGASTLFQNTKWEPGFKVGLGMDFGHDHWSGYAEYTWFRSRTTTSVTTPALTVTGAINPAWMIHNWDMGQTSNTVLTPRSLSSVWRLRMDLLDAALTRPYYQGKYLIIAPFGGFRAAWIRQNLRIVPSDFVDQNNIPGLLFNPNAVIHNKSNSWAIGPRAGFQARWHLGWGFRFEGDMAGSITYTRYSGVRNITDFYSREFVPARIGLNYGHYNTLRFNNDMNVGLGWGDYFDCRNYHLDILLTYDFQIFWNQNMMRSLVDSGGSGVGVGAGPANLYLQGLTVKAQFDF